VYLVRILISDDHSVLRDGLKPFVSKVTEDVEILEANDYASTNRTLKNALANNEAIDLVILDLRMPGMAGSNHMGAASQLKRDFPDIPMVIMSGGISQAEALQAVQLKFLGFLPKSMSGTAMIHALRLIMCGEVYFPPEILLPADAQVSTGLDPQHISTPTIPNAMTDGGQIYGMEHTGSSSETSLDVLTRREKELLTHLVEGASNRKIADSLGLTEITIKSHLRNIYRKIGANNRTQAVTFALNAGIKGAHTPN